MFRDNPRMLEKQRRGTLGLVNNDEAKAIYEGMFNVGLDASIESIEP